MTFNWLYIEPEQTGKIILPAELDCHRLYKTTIDQTSKDTVMKKIKVMLVFLKKLICNDVQC